MALSQRGRKVLAWSVTGIAVASAIAIPVGVVYGTRTPEEEQVDKTASAADLVSVTYGTELNSAAVLTVNDPDYLVADYEDPSLVDVTGYTSTTPAGTANLRVVLWFKARASDVSDKLVTYRLRVAKATPAVGNDVTITYGSYVYKTDLLSDEGVDFASFARGAELRKGYVLVTDPRSVDAPYFSTSPAGLTEDFAATEIDAVNQHARNLNVNNGNAQFFLVFLSNLDTVNYEGNLLQLKTIVKIPVNPAAATIHEDRSVTASGFAYGDTELPAAEAPDYYEDYIRSVSYTRIAGSARTSLEVGGFPSVPAGEMIEAVYSYDPSPNYRDGKPFSVTKTFTVAKAAVNGVRNVQPIDPSSIAGSRVKTGGTIVPRPASEVTVRQGFELDASKPSYFKVTTLAGSATSSDPQIGDRIENDEAGRRTLANLAAGYRFDQVFTGKLTAAMAENHVLAAGTEETYTIEWIVDPAPIVKQLDFYVADSSFAKNFVTGEDIARPVRAGHLPWELLSITRSDDGSTQDDVPIANNVAQLQAASTDAAGVGVRTVTATFISRPGGGRAVVDTYQVVYTLRDDDSYWRFQMKPKDDIPATTIGFASDSMDFAGNRLTPTVTVDSIVLAKFGGAEITKERAVGFLTGKEAVDKLLDVSFKITGVTLKRLVITGGGDGPAANLFLIERYGSDASGDFGADKGAGLRAGGWSVSMDVAYKNAAKPAYATLLV